MHDRAIPRFPQPRSWKRIAAGMVTIALLPRAGLATSTGISSASGKFGGFCTACHSPQSGAAPIVEFETPDGIQFNVGQMATFRFKITSQDRRKTHAGLDVGASGGTLGAPEPGTKLLGFGVNTDVTHTAPRENDENDVALFTFTWTAPATPGTYTLFGAGNSVNNDGETTGDNSARTTLAINVVGLSTPTPTSPPPTDTETPMPTATPTNTIGDPTPTATQGGGCTGDCDGDGSVTVDEIVRGVNIGLGTRPVEDCLPFDRDGSGTVTVDEIVEAIGNALNGCS
jgi:hypothetical protein